MQLIAEACARTHSPAVRKSRASFGALYSLAAVTKKYRRPVLVSGTDGVGTKMLIAKKHGCYDFIGQDCVAMCVNDIACHGARPLFFLDYLACGSLDPATAARIVSGMAAACGACGASLVGGETAEMPGMYAAGDYDVAGFAVGVVNEDDIVDGDGMQEGDALIGLTSSGAHSNGFSLLRALYPNTAANFFGSPLYQTLLTPTRLYVNAFLALKDALNKNKKRKKLRALAHITGGGIFENLGRTVRPSLRAHVDASSVPKQKLFEDIARKKTTAPRELWRTLNMGVGAVAVVDAAAARDALAILAAAGEQAFVLGDVRRAQPGELSAEFSPEVFRGHQNQTTGNEHNVVLHGLQ